MEAAMSMLQVKKLPNKLGAEAVNYEWDRSTDLDLPGSGS